jgi:DNA invertase Pin-like site-specific DNA recombinase
MDRSGRVLRHLANALADLESLGVTFVSLKDNLDLSAPSGRLMFQTIGAMAEWERSLIQERLRAVMRNAQANGRPIGRPSADSDLAENARLRDSGASLRAIAPPLGVSVGKVAAVQKGYRKTVP